MDWWRQFPGSEPGDPDGMHLRREMARVGVPLNLHQLPHLRRAAERWIPLVNVNSPGDVLDYGSLEIGQGGCNHTTEQHTLATRRLLGSQPMNLFCIR